MVAQRNGTRRPGSALFRSSSRHKIQVNDPGVGLLGRSQRRNDVWQSVACDFSRIFAQFSLGFSVFSLSFRLYFPPIYNDAAQVANVTHLLLTFFASPVADVDPPICNDTPLPSLPVAYDSLHWSRMFTFAYRP